MNLNAKRAIWAVVPASGIGNRMAAGFPKQYLRFHGKTILEHTLDRLFSYSKLDGVMLVLNESDSYWDELNYRAPGDLRFTVGGRERIHSVLFGLQELQTFLNEDALILVHDAVRPLVATEELERVVNAAMTAEDGALLAVPVADTLKQQQTDHAAVNQTVPREKLWRALTPQVFQLSLLLEALRSSLDRSELVSDDSAAMELAGYHPRLVMGSSSNIKITLPEDLGMAEQIWLYQRNQQNDE